MLTTMGQSLEDIKNQDFSKIENLIKMKIDDISKEKHVSRSSMSGEEFIRRMESMGAGKK